MTPREWAAERRAATLREDDEIRRAYRAASLYALGVRGKLPPLHSLLSPTGNREALSMQLDQLSDRLGLPFQKASPETLAALERMRARG